MLAIHSRTTLLFLGILFFAIACSARSKAPTVPPPIIDEAKAAAPAKESAVLAGGCFWGIQAVFQHVKGVIRATDGYSGGSAQTAEYQIVSTGKTGHAESVEVVYDSSQITYGQLLQIFFSVAHDPTELNRQGPDEGTQYRSAIFYTNEEQKRIAESYIVQLEAAKVFRHKIVTQVVPFKAFYPAEAYHQNFAELHPNNLYIAFNDAPKVAHLKEEFPDLYMAKATQIAKAQ